MQYFNTLNLTFVIKVNISSHLFIQIVIDVKAEEGSLSESLKKLNFCTYLQNEDNFHFHPQSTYHVYEHDDTSRVQRKSDYL